MNANNYTGAEIVLQVLKDNNCDVIFGYPGGAVLPIYDALFKQNHIRHILVRHEQAAAHAAEGYARSTGKVGVFLVTSGPGATNAITGLTDALMDSIPVICISGQVPTHVIGSDAFQECDTTGISRSCTKHNILVRDVNDLASCMHDAFHVAQTGRPGPILIDIPKDVQFALGTYSKKREELHPSYRPPYAPNEERIKEAARMISKAKRPLIYAGGGVINSGDAACALLAKFIKQHNIPFTLTLMGLGAAPASYSQFLGMVGMHGSFEANMAMHDCDVMINIGARFDDRVTGKLDAFSPNSKKIHIDIDPSSINKNIPVDISILADAGEALKSLAEAMKQYSFPQARLNPWFNTIDKWRKKKCFSYKPSKEIIKPQYALQRLNELVEKNKKDVIYTTEVGQHQMWAAQFLPFEQPKKWLTSGGLGTMGYGLPAAIGAQIAYPDSLVIDIAGEASILMNQQELSTAKQYRLPVKIFILNNQYMGMVRQWQELLHGGRYSESYSEALPDFVKLAEAFGLVGVRAETMDQLDDAIETMLNTNSCVIADIRVDPKENCYPMIPSGSPHNEMIFAESNENTIKGDGQVLV